MLSANTGGVPTDPNSAECGYADRAESSDQGGDEQEPHEQDMQPVAQRFGAAQIHRQLVLPEEYLVLPEEYEVHIAGKGEIVDR